MRKYNENLFNAMLEGKNSCKCGNHAMIKTDNGYIFTYHGNTIVCINNIDNVIIFDNCGYDYSPSTTQAINGYIDMIEYSNINHHNYDKVDLSYNKKFEDRIKAVLDCKIVMNKEEYKQLARINSHNFVY